MKHLQIKIVLIQARMHHPEHGPLLSDDRILAIEMGLRGIGEEKLGAHRVRAIVCHG
jgi:hypothetical protein